jgi:hypothetical protein
VEAKRPTAIEDAAAREREESAKRIRQIESEIKAKEEAIKKTIAAKPSAPAQPKVAPVVPSARPSAPPPEAVKAPATGSATKEARLAELLQKYKADQITPHEYHMQRAKILAEP